MIFKKNLQNFYVTKQSLSFFLPKNESNPDHLFISSCNSKYLVNLYHMLILISMKSVKVNFIILRDASNIMNSNIIFYLFLNNRQHCYRKSAVNLQINNV